MEDFIIKALKIRYILMDCFLVDIQCLLQAFGEAKTWNFDIKPTEKFAYLRQGGTSLKTLIWLEFRMLIIACYVMAWILIINAKCLQRNQKSTLERKRTYSNKNDTLY